MTIWNLFIIILKILGIFFIKDILETLPQLISVVYLLMDTSTFVQGMWTLIMTIITLVAYGIVSYYLIFKFDLIIDKFRLDKGFSQDLIPLNIHRSSVLSISIIIVGGLIIVDEIPNFCHQLFAYYQEKRMTYGATNPSITYTIQWGIKILVGLLLVGNQRQIVNFIERKRRDRLH